MIEFEATDAEAKTLGAKWDRAASKFTLPAARFHAHQLIDLGLADASLLDGLEPHRAAYEDDVLYPAQIDAIQRLLAMPRGALVVLPPGYGKCAVTVKAALRAGIDDIMLIAPTTLQKNWEREITKWGGDLSHWSITSWDKFARNADAWGKHYLLVLDETVMMKSRHSNRYEKIIKARKNYVTAWLLSGSPTSRYYDDLFTQLRMIWPKAFPSYWRFASRYCVVEETPWARVVAGNKRNADPVGENSDLILVASQSIDLPEYIYKTVDVELTEKQQIAYDTMETDFISELESGETVSAVNQAVKLLRLQQITSFWDEESAKHDALIDILPTVPGPHLIWSHWLQGANALHNRLSQSGLRGHLVTGEAPTRIRDEYIEDYKEGNVDYLILSIGVGKFGHTLINSGSIHFVDKTWNADDYFQALHRTRRIGLKHRPWLVTYRAPGTSDDLVEDNLSGKLPGMSKLTNTELATLLRGLK